MIKNKISALVQFSNGSTLISLQLIITLIQLIIQLIWKFYTKLQENFDEKRKTTDF